MRKLILVTLIMLLLTLGCVDLERLKAGETTTNQKTGQTSSTLIPTTTVLTTSTISKTTITSISTQTTSTATSPQVEGNKTLPKADDYELVKIADGFQNPLYLTHSGDGTGRLFIVEQRGVIWILDKGYVKIKTPFLDISDRVRSGGEQGLLGLTFHPKYRENGVFYVHYSDKNGDTVVSRFKVGTHPDKADPDSEVTILTQDQPFRNHNGGQIAFGPDEYLYIGLGDGGAAGDPFGNGQNLSTLLGKILRINVDEGRPYSIPEGNPFKGSQKERPEIWAYGLRNPWRFSFDRLTGDLFIADVGQNRWEEIDFQPAASAEGVNYGWNRMEGKHCFVEGCDPKTYAAPVAEYSHADGCSVTGGYVYRGALNRDLNGKYFYGDYCSGLIWALYKTDAGTWINELWLKTSLSISSFGEDESGEIYVVDHGGAVFLLNNRRMP